MTLADRIPLNSEKDSFTAFLSLILVSLIFLGSKSYPYKGVLDQLANRAGSNGTNAWTSNDRKFITYPYRRYDLT